MSGSGWGEPWWPRNRRCGSQMEAGAEETGGSLVWRYKPQLNSLTSDIWKKVFLQDVMENQLGLFNCEDPGQAGVGPEHHKLLVRLESDLKESQQLVRLQQQLLQVRELSVMQRFQRWSYSSISCTVGSLRTVLLRPSLPNWPIPTFWKSGSVSSCTGQSSVIRRGLLKERGSPSLKPPSDWAVRWE